MATKKEKKKSVTKKIRTSIAFTPSLHAALVEKAQRNKMSLSDYVEGIASKVARRN